MERLCTLLMGSAIALMAYGSAVATERTHELTVRLRDGSVEHIRYFGDQPPDVSFSGGTSRNIVSADDDIFASPLMDIERISAALDRQHAAIMRMAFLPGPSADLSKLPKGATGYSIISMTSGGKTCTTRLRYFGGGGDQPRVEKTSSGDCDVGHKSSASAVETVAPRRPAALPVTGKAIEANYRQDSKMKTVETAGLY
jgi:hypothetical protein